MLLELSLSEGIVLGLVATNDYLENSVFMRVNMRTGCEDQPVVTLASRLTSSQMHAGTTRIACH